jgi:bla regulator protein blaR1
MTVPALWNESWTDALVNHLWQSTVVAGIAWLLAISLRKYHARFRYWVWFTASIKFLLPFSLLIAAGEWLRSWLPTSAAQPAVAGVVEQIAQPFALAQVFDTTAAPLAVHRTNWLPTVLLVFWAFGALLVAARFARGWWTAHATRLAARPLELAAEVPILSTPGLIEPGILGIFHPVLLLPSGIQERLTKEQFAAIAAHEMCHVRRRDNLTYAIHMVVETLFWFHPAVWWIGARLIDERERACDESVVQAGGAAEIYAESILSVCKFYVESPLACAGITGSDLKKRVLRIMSEAPATELTQCARFAIAAICTIAVATPLVAGLIGGIRVSAQLLQANGPRPSFEVATIKPNNDPHAGTRVQMAPDHFSATHVSLRDLVKFAYAAGTDKQIDGGPAWINTEYFDILAKDSDAEISAFHNLDFDHRTAMSRLTIQSLLQDRFQLKAHIETRELPVYALVIAKGGIKMKEVQEELRPPGGHAPPGPHLPYLRPTGENQYTATAWPMKLFPEFLSHYFYEVGDRPVVDETGLKGNYDWVLSGVAMRAPAPGAANGTAAHEATVSLFAALPEQLGLKLESQKAPVEVLVIDHVEQPSPN